MKWDYKFATLALLLVLFASSASAQTVERTIDLSSLGWGLVTPHMVETDGNPATEEWAIQGTFFGFSVNQGGNWRVVAVRNGGLCVGEWFNPGAGTVALTRGVDGRSRLLVTETAYNWKVNNIPQQTARVVLLDTPNCQQ